MTLDGAYRRYGLSLIDSLPDWYGLVLDEEARAAFRQAVENGEIYNFISSWLRPKWERLGLALQGFAEEANVAVGLRDFVRRNRDIVALAGGVAAKVAFDEWCRHNPPKSPEEARLRQLVSMVLDAYNVGIAAYADFKTALGFVHSLRAAAAGAGMSAALSAAAAGVSLLQSALS